MRWSTLAAACWISALLIGCSDVDVEDGTGGAGGVSASSSKSTKHAGAGPTANGSQTGPSANASGSTVSTSGGGLNNGAVTTGPDLPPGSACDTHQSDVSSLWCKQCQQCAFGSVCEAVVEACQSDQECVAYTECLQSCDDCDCAADHPAGEPLHAAILDCLGCACQASCGLEMACE
ncbi:MAG: hypothetical protein HOV80_33400 [Polyangiaceae bacterium]|nr:hypothetical protein [Polyangiaceae bacterium]